MFLKSQVDRILKSQNRSMSWLAAEMDLTFEGLKSALVKESLKYRDIQKMAKILQVPPSVFFPEERKDHLNEPHHPYQSLREELTAYKKLNQVLSNQIRDKDRIIRLLSAGAR